MCWGRLAAGRKAGIAGAELTAGTWFSPSGTLAQLPSQGVHLSTFRRVVSCQFFLVDLPMPILVIFERLSHLYQELRLPLDWIDAVWGDEQLKVWIVFSSAAIEPVEEHRFLLHKIRS